MRQKKSEPATEQKKAEKLLYEREEHFHSLYDESPSLPIPG